MHLASGDIRPASIHVSHLNTMAVSFQQSDYAEISSRQ
jgi:hypothetical protein